MADREAHGELDGARRMVGCLSRLGVHVQVSVPLEALRGWLIPFRWLLPVLVFLPLLPLHKLRLRPLGKQPPKQPDHPTEPTTAETLLITLSDLHMIYALIPPSPLPSATDIYDRFQQLGPRRLVRGCVVIWMTWIVLGHIIGFRTLLGLLGSIVLLLPSPALAHTYKLLSRSLAVRRSIALAFLFAFGSPPDQSYRFGLGFSPTSWIKGKWAVSRRPSLAFSFRPKMPEKADPLQGSALDDSEEEEMATRPIYFRFEVHENQRWWMGLDWTSALLPNERPSWCDSHLLPVSPPASFFLPASASVVLPNPTPTDPHAQVKRTAVWKWVDDDWQIVRAGVGLNGQPITSPATGSSPTMPDASGTGEGVEPGHQPRSLSMSFGSSPPKTEEPVSATTAAKHMAEQAFTKGLQRLKERTGAPGSSASNRASTTSPSRHSADMTRARTSSQASEDLKTLEMESQGTAVLPPVPLETILEKDDATDTDGWVYGDNAWAHPGPKGGLGKFTRRRRWQRRAVCVETVLKIVVEPPRTAKGKEEEEDAPLAPDTDATATPMGTPVVSSLKAGPSISLAKMVKAEPIIDDKPLSEVSELGSVIPPVNSGADGSRDDVLRQRLKKAMGNAGA